MLPQGTSQFTLYLTFFTAPPDGWQMINSGTELRARDKFGRGVSHNSSSKRRAPSSVVHQPRDSQSQLPFLPAVRRKEKLLLQQIKRPF
jgi:hypothetical protein